MAEHAVPHGRRVRPPGRHVPGARLSAFLDDELDDDSALALTRHVTSCPACHRELEELRDTRGALRRLPALQAPVLTAERRGLARVRTWSRRLVATAMVSVVLLGIVATAYVAGGAGGEVTPPVDRFLLDHLARTGDSPVPMPVGGPSR